MLYKYLNDPTPPAPQRTSTPELNDELAPTDLFAQWFNRAPLSTDFSPNYWGWWPANGDHDLGPYFSAGYSGSVFNQTPIQKEVNLLEPVTIIKSRKEDFGDGVLRDVGEWPFIQEEDVVRFADGASLSMHVLSADSWTRTQAYDLFNAMHKGFTVEFWAKLSDSNVPNAASTSKLFQITSTLPLAVGDWPINQTIDENTTHIGGSAGKTHVGYAPSFDVRVRSSNGTVAFMGANVPLDAWNHFAVTVVRPSETDTGYQTIYHLNGVQVASINTANPSVGGVLQFSQGTDTHRVERWPQAFWNNARININPDGLGSPTKGLPLQMTGLNLWQSPRYAVGSTFTPVFKGFDGGGPKTFVHTPKVYTPTRTDAPWASWDFNRANNSVLATPQVWSGPQVPTTTIVRGPKVGTTTSGSPSTTYPKHLTTQYAIMNNKTGIVQPAVQSMWFNASLDSTNKLQYNKYRVSTAPATGFSSAISTNDGFTIEAWVFREASQTFAFQPEEQTEGKEFFFSLHGITAVGSGTTIAQAGYEDNSLLGYSARKQNVMRIFSNSSSNGRNAVYLDNHVIGERNWQHIAMSVIPPNKVMIGGSLNTDWRVCYFLNGNPLMMDGVGYYQTFPFANFRPTASGQGSFSGYLEIGAVQMTGLAMREMHLFNYARYLTEFVPDFAATRGAAPSQY